MSAINNNVVLVGQRLVNNPQTGNSWAVDYKGTLSAILALRTTYNNIGVQVTADVSGPVCTLTATFPYDPTQPATSEAPIDRYELTRDRVMVSIFAAPNVAAEAKRFGAAQYKKLIEEAVEEGLTAPNMVDIGFPLVQPVFDDLCRGVEGYETERPVLSRTRTYSAIYADRTKIQARPSVFLTATLVSTFGIPAVVANLLPDDPPATDTPEGTVWAWKTQSDTSTIIPSSNRIEEHKSWTFSAWSTLLYSVT